MASSPVMPEVPMVPMPAFPTAGKEKLAQDASLWVATWGWKAELGSFACMLGGALLFMFGLRLGSKPAAKAGLGMALFGVAALIAVRLLGVIVGGGR